MVGGRAHLSIARIVGMQWNGNYVGRNKEGIWRGRGRESVKVIIFEWKLSEREVGKEGRSIL